ncbi:hypothetical protein [Paremcibacter congregatus]|uniref:Uncharacterized protein n=1 Tax=Paremcibacter congregatus TaxID=2043170 RepID=A0A2G4YV61_9PROT|nr:hypothetical protein [Paremcibacter congregatus]PHZ86173.1 hypothetical protein CRD36_05765 [Paremcibacter congregatus]QDE27137.1 hypothetical protein FIV45_07530 [Paremcibacter congregatus]
MSDKRLDHYLEVFRVETNIEPSRALMDKIIGIPQSECVRSEQAGFFNLWRFFDGLVPRALGWALTGCLGLYLGLSSGNQPQQEQAFPLDENYYIYGQVQVLLSEELVLEDEEGDK